MSFHQVQENLRGYMERGASGLSPESAQILVRMRAFDMLSIGVTCMIGIVAPIYLGSFRIAAVASALLFFFLTCHWVAPLDKGRHVKLVARASTLVPVPFIVVAVAVLGAPVGVGHMLLVMMILAAAHLLGVKDAIAFTALGIGALAVMSVYGPQEMSSSGALEVSPGVFFATRAVLLCAILGYAIASRLAEDRNAAQLRAMARTDPLTGVATRAELEEKLEDAIARAQRSGQSGAFLFLDLDHFKPINDRLGHHAGDTVLRAVASRLLDFVRTTDTVGRVGGDEFGIVLSDVAEGKGQDVFARRLQEIMSLSVDISGEAVQVGASIGIARFPESGDHADIVIRRADEAMYAAKESGRHCTWRWTAAALVPAD
jgi:diguanylate cyclase (GGDEF)-like protein